MSAAVKELHQEIGESKAALLTQTSNEAGKMGSTGPPTSAAVTVEVEEGITKRKGSKVSEQSGAVLVVVRDRVTGALHEDSPARKGLTWTGHLFAVLLPFLCMLMGGLYIDDCPANWYIPIYLIVLGAITALAHISTSIDICRKLPYTQRGGEQKPAVLTVISIFLLVWIILGCVWTFSIYTPEFEPWMYPRFGYCHYNLYWFTFWVNILALATWVLGFCLCCCMFGIVCCAAAAEKKSRQELPPEVKV